MNLYYNITNIYITYLKKNKSHIDILHIIVFFLLNKNFNSIKTLYNLFSFLSLQQMNIANINIDLKVVVLLNQYLFCDHYTTMKEEYII